MSTNNDGGPAFPSTLQYFPEDTNYRLEQGMALRDYLAAKAMAGMISTEITMPKAADMEIIASCAYKLADAMLDAREK